MTPDERFRAAILSLSRRAVFFLRCAGLMRVVQHDRIRPASGLIVTNLPIRHAAVHGKYLQCSGIAVQVLGSRLIAS
jgi:hypothetical protein